MARSKMLLAAWPLLAACASAPSRPPHPPGPPPMLPRSSVAAVLEHRGEARAR
ncbi:MAG: hypothetical protein QM765_26290 [Myxococcales bacterium]